MSSLTERLRNDARRITGPRKAILELLQRHAHPLANREILEGLPKGGCDLATVYRAVHLLEALGLVKRYDFGDGIARFELVADEGPNHHHHLVCTRCAHVVELEECFSVEIERRIAIKNGFKAVTHRLEFFGICPECQEG
jgi:Fur family ferric uptake transcriptional regulator